MKGLVISQSDNKRLPYKAQFSHVQEFRLVIIESWWRCGDTHEVTIVVEINKFITYLQSVTTIALADAVFSITSTVVS